MGEFEGEERAQGGHVGHDYVGADFEGGPVNCFGVFPCLWVREVRSGYASEKGAWLGMGEREKQGDICLHVRLFVVLSVVRITMRVAEMAHVLAQKEKSSQLTLQFEVLFE